ncbi:RagB/SusD family nutrient uptake outer membrane protein [Arcticibacter eurypsychrophilus]|uniref:RagB/SusD family nutrient uptake outer membrane protein n=1 Tax=Arcticibacter eurypsychrophilus TaxID=1434752 RepID=UPI00084D1B0F|nr:RagB/SusD family nutrient uptake outer membrane protein [Arcticibacter eurypsychrophilus]
MKQLSKTIKQTLRYSLAALILMSSTISCKKELESKVYTELTPENFFKSEADFNAALITLYSTMTSNWGNPDPGASTWYSSFYSPDISSYWLKSMISTDEMGTDGQPDLVNFTFGPSTWQGGNDPIYSKVRYVARATDIIDKIGTATGVSDDVKTKYLAEAKCMRAWIMYNIYDFFGAVNVKLDPAVLGDNAITPRMSDADYVNQMIVDLTEALPGLPDKYNADAQNWGRISKGVARMLLLKVYMHTHQWSLAEVTGKEILGMGYTLEQKYADVFIKKQNNELIYAIPSNEALPNIYPTEVLPTDFASSGSYRFSTGWYAYWMPWSFYDKYESGDLRKSTIFDSYTNTQGKVINRSNGLRAAIPMKYTGIQGSGPGYTTDVVVFRLAEVLLSVAEAINEQRGPAEAYQYVNQVRKRAGINDFSGMNTETFRNAILDERARELYAEGTRRQDLIRHNLFISNAIARGKTNAKPYMVLFPIPSNVMIEGAGTITQNSGY